MNRDLETNEKEGYISNWKPQRRVRKIRAEKTIEEINRLKILQI